MAITYPLDFCQATGVRNVLWLAENSVSKTESIWSMSTKVYSWGTQRWTVEIQLPSMTMENARTWEAWFLSLNGLEGTFWFAPVADSIPQGVATGTPLINGASQSGQSLITDGWTPSQTGILKAGDWIQVGNYLHRILQDVDSDVGGNATLDIFPSLSKAVPSDNDPITTSNPKGKFRLVEFPGMNQTVNRLVEGTSFRAIEDV